MATDQAPRQPGVMPAERQDRMLRAAAHEFAEHGYEQASLNRVIRAVGMSKSSFYHFVGSKERLFDAVVAAFGPGLVAAMRPPTVAQLEADFWGELESLVHRLAQAGQQDPAHWLLGRMWYLPGAPNDDSSALGRGKAGLERWLRQALDTGRRAGSVRTDLPADLQAKLLVAVGQVLDEWMLTAQEANDAEALVGAQLAAVRRLLGPD